MILLLHEGRPAARQKSSMICKFIRTRADKNILCIINFLFVSFGPVLCFDCASFEDVVLLVPVAGPERKPVEGDSKVSVIKSINERIQ